MPAIGDLTGVIAPNEIITFTTTDLNTITSATLGGESLTIDSEVANLVTCTIPFDINIVWGTAGLTLTASDGTDSADIPALTLLDRVGWGSILFDGVIPAELSTESFYWLTVNDLGITPLIPDQLQYEDSVGLTVDGSWVPTIDPALNVEGSWAVFDVSTDSRSAEQTYDIFQPLIENLTGDIVPDGVITFDVPDIFDPITSVTLGGESLVIDGQVGTTVTCTIPDDINIPWETTGLSLIADDSTSVVQVDDLTLLNRVGWFSELFTGPIPAEGSTESFYWLSVNDRAFTPEVGDQLRVSSEVGLTVDGSWLPTVDPEDDVYGNWEVLDISTSTVLPPLEFSITRPDTTPYPFNFTDQSDIVLNTVTISGIITVEGLINPVALSVVDGEYSLNSAAYTSAPSVVDTGDTLQLRTTSSSSHFTPVITTLDAGGWSTDWTVTTVKSFLPDAIVFTPVVDADLSTVYTSNTETVTGITDTVDISVTAGGEFSINGGAFTSVTGTIDLNDTVSVRQTSSASYLTETVITLSVGELDTDYSVTTAGNLNPIPELVFNSVIDVDVNTLTPSNVEIVLGLTGASPIEVEGGSYSINGGAFTTVAGTVVNDDTVTLRVLSSLDNNTTSTVTVTVGTADSSFYVTTSALGSSIIYLLLGLTPADIPAEVIDYFIAQWSLIYPDNNCMVIYNTVKSIYNWLVGSASAKAVSGKRREKRGRREIEVENSNNAVNWKTALDNFLKSPWEILPQCRADFVANGAGNSRLTVGGTKKDEVERVRDDPNSFNQYSETSPYSPKPRIGRRGLRGNVKL